MKRSLEETDDSAKKSKWNNKGVLVNVFKSDSLHKARQKQKRLLQGKKWSHDLFSVVKGIEVGDKILHMDNSDGLLGLLTALYFKTSQTTIVSESVVSSHECRQLLDELASNLFYSFILDGNGIQFHAMGTSSKANEVIHEIPLNIKENVKIVHSAIDEFMSSQDDNSVSLITW